MYLIAISRRSWKLIRTPGRDQRFGSGEVVPSLQIALVHLQLIRTNVRFWGEPRTAGKANATAHKRHDTVMQACPLSGALGGDLYVRKEGAQCSHERLGPPCPLCAFVAVIGQITVHYGMTYWAGEILKSISHLSFVLSPETYSEIEFASSFTCRSGTT